MAWDFFRFGVGLCGLGRLVVNLRFGFDPSCMVCWVFGCCVCEVWDVDLV